MQKSNKLKIEDIPRVKKHAISNELTTLEDLWRIIKDRIYKTYYNTLNELIEIFEGGFRDFVGRESLYENWLEDMV